MVKAKKKEEKEEMELDDSFSKKFLGKYIKDNKNEIYTDSDIHYKVSMGSLILDVETGGIHPGMHRFCGFNEGGKTSEALQCMGNALANEKGMKGILIKAEGRLSDEMKERNNVKFVTNVDDWEEGTCFILDCNIYETICNLIEGLIKNNPEKIKYFIILDSLDGLILRDDSTKKFDGNNKVAGVPLLTSRLMQKLSLPIGKFGHILILISQVRQDIKIDTYSSSPIRQTTASGGNAALHFADWIFQFEPRFKGDLILEKPDENPDRIKNKILGHWAKIIVKKSPNEKTNLHLHYPIRYGRKNGNSIWVEYEIVELLLSWDLLVKNGSWCSFSEELIRELGEHNMTLTEKIQGINNVRIYLEENPDITKYLYEKFKKLMK